MRVNVEERCFASSNIKRLAKLMKWNEPTAMGTLVYLWHDSQAELKTSCTKEDLEVWCRLKNKNQSEQLAQALITSGWLEKLEENLFYIRGNEKQVNASVIIKEASLRGGESTRKRHFEDRTQINQRSTIGQRPPRRSPSALSEGGRYARPSEGSIQFNTIQCNTMQKDKEIYISSDSEIPLIDIQNESSINSHKFDYENKFKELWELYPKKEGKKEAFRSFKRDIQTEEKFNLMRKALENYIRICATREYQFIKNGSSWFNQWEDFIDYQEPITQTNLLYKTPAAKVSENNQAIAEQLKQKWEEVQNAKREETQISNAVIDPC